MSFYLDWDKPGEKFWETGVDRGVLFPQNPADGTYEEGVVWNGLTSVKVTPSGGEPNAQYADNIKYLNLFSLEEVGATIEAFTYPDEFMACDGSAPVAEKSKLYARTQTRKPFGFTWRSKVGNDLDDDAAYIIHILYGCKASPSEREYNTVNESPEAQNMSWEITTTPPSIGVEGLKNTSLFEADTRNFVTAAEKAMITALEQKLYGVAADSAATPAVEEVKPAMPTVEQLITMMSPQG